MLTHRTEAKKRVTRSSSSRPSTPSSSSSVSKSLPPKTPTSEDRGTKRKRSPEKITIPEEFQPRSEAKRNKKKQSPWPYMEQEEDEEEEEDAEKEEEEGAENEEEEEGEREGSSEKRRYNASSYAKYPSNSTKSNPRKKHALNTQTTTTTTTTEIPKRTRAMCPPNSSTPYPATPFPCPFWGCPFAFRTRAEVGPHFATHNVEYANATLIRGVDIVALREVDDWVFSDRYMKGSQPVVIKGTPNNWQISKWDMDYLAKKYGGNQTVWYDLETENDEIEQYTGTFREFTTELKKSATLYASVIFNFPKKWQKLPQFAVNYMDCLPPNSFESYCRLFVGHTGTFTALHRDFLDTTITAVKGTKRVILFPPNSFAHLQQLFPPLRTKAHKEDFVHFFFDLYLSEEDRMKVMDAGGRVVFLQPGFSLYIPGGWYHQVSNLEENTISLSNACVTRHNISFFIQNEHPEQLSMSLLLTAAIENFHSRVLNFSPPVIVGRNKAKVLKIGVNCKANNNYKATPSPLNELLRLLEEAYSLEAAMHARVKVEEDGNLNVIKIEKHVRKQLTDSIAILQDHIHNL